MRRNKGGLFLLFPNDIDVSKLNLHIRDPYEFAGCCRGSPEQFGIVGYIFPTVNQIIKMLEGQKVFDKDLNVFYARNFNKYLIGKFEVYENMIIDALRKKTHDIKKSYSRLPNLGASYLKGLINEKK